MFNNQVWHILGFMESTDIIISICRIFFAIGERLLLYPIEAGPLNSKSRFSRVLQGQPGVISLRMQYPKEKRP